MGNTDRRLLGLMWSQFAPFAASEPERNLAPKIPSTGFLIGLHLSNALTDTVALGLSEGGRYRQEQLAESVARKRR